MTLTMMICYFVVSRWRRRAIVTGGGSTLRLLNVTESDAGVLQCNASNEHGYLLANVHLTIHGLCRLLPFCFRVWLLCLSPTRRALLFDHNHTLPSPTFHFVCLFATAFSIENYSTDFHKIRWKCGTRATEERYLPNYLTLILT